MDKRKIALAKYRLDKSREELGSSKTLLEKGLYSSSISSSYYSIFHAVRTIFAFEEIDSKRHSGVIRLFSERFIKTNLLDTKMKDILAHAFEYRLDSDYEDFYVAEKETAEKQTKNAEYFINEIIIFCSSHYKVEL